MQLRYIQNKIQITDKKPKHVVKEYTKHKCLSILCAKLLNTNLDHI